MRDYFCGWYFKCQTNTQTLAVIPAMHTSKKGRTCSLQVITNEGADMLVLPYEQFSMCKRGLHIKIGENRFGTEGMELHIDTPSLCVEGSVRFAEITPIRYDIMGPFRFVPFMECRHGVFSMRHRVAGQISVNGTAYQFWRGVGYIEGDRGYSFPKEYAWTQCCFEGGSLMLSIATIPLGLIHFTGVIGVVLWQGKEYRLATYLGAKIIKLEKGEIVIRQGNKIFSAKLLEKHPHPLLAPVDGAMTRTIHESAACRACYSFEENGQQLFAFESPMASFEYEYSR